MSANHNHEIDNHLYNITVLTYDVIPTKIQIAEAEQLLHIEKLNNRYE